jgi:hypothetical protein
MKMLWISLSLMLMLVQLPFGPLAPDKPEEEKEKSPIKGWRMVTSLGVPPTQYSRVGKDIIKAESLGARSSLFKKIETKNPDLLILSWKWKVSNVIRSAIETKKGRYDAAARVIVVFGKEGGFTFMARGEPQGYKMEYIWASRLPRGHLFDHPEENFCKVFVLESGESRVGQWVYEERNIYKDFKAAFETTPESILAIGIQTDTDHSNERVTTYYSEPVLKKK